MKQLLFLSFACVLAACAAAETCTTQSQMEPAERDSLVRAATSFAQEVQANDAGTIKSNTIPLVAQDFSGIQSSISDTAPHLKTANFAVDTVWVLDATAVQATNGKPADAQFFCNLNRSAAQVSFLIPSLPQGRYALAVVNAAASNSLPFQLAFLMQRSSSGVWQLAGFYPRATLAANHDGLWYWRQGREFAAKKQNWNAWIAYEEAEQLLRPVPFMTSTHLDQLQDEWSKAAPTALSAGIRPDTPLVIRGKDGAEYRLTALAADSSLGAPKLDVAVHIAAEPINDPVAARARNLQAARAFVAAYPELRDSFHGVWVFADPPSGSTFASEEPMDRLTL